VTLSVKPLANKTCAATNYDINGTQYSGPVSLTAPGEIAASKTATETYKIGFYDETTDQSDCEGATVTMTYASA
jgi:hypothetical protein